MEWALPIVSFLTSTSTVDFDSIPSTSTVDFDSISPIFVLPYATSARKSGNSANLPPHGNPRTNLTAPAKGLIPFSWHSAAIHAATDAAAPKSKNAVHTLPSKPATPDLQPKTPDMRTHRIERNIRRHLGIGIWRNRHLRHRQRRRKGKYGKAHFGHNAVFSLNSAIIPHNLPTYTYNFNPNPKPHKRQNQAIRKNNTIIPGASLLNLSEYHP